MKLSALEGLETGSCNELESLPKHVWDGLCFLRRLEICSCQGLRSLPEGVRHLTSLEVLRIYDCPTLIEWCRGGLAQDSPRSTSIYIVEHVLDFCACRLLFVSCSSITNPDTALLSFVS